MENQIELFAQQNGFSAQDAAEIADIINLLFNSNEYSEIWDSYFSRYSSLNELIESEKDQGPYGMTENECLHQVNKSIFKLSSGLYIHSVK